ncbi:MAG: hypothetical protein IT449_02045 [Phycisphaerales bacterium]|nr:hypothetical protein [Phycisphaerales bacterium]
MALQACDAITGPFGADGSSEECRSQCELAAAQCDEQPLESFPPFLQRLDEWRDEADSEACQRGQIARYAAECSNERDVLVEQSGEVAYYYFYDRSTGAFLGLRTRTDTNYYPPCNAVGYWPEIISCSDPLVTEALCDGGAYEVGDALSLP